MSEKIPSKADALRAMREANYSAKSSEVGKPAPRMSTPSAVRGKSIGANDMPSPETSGASESNSVGERPMSSGGKSEQPTGASSRGKVPATIRGEVKPTKVERGECGQAPRPPEANSAKVRPTSSALASATTGGNVTRSSGGQFPGGAPSSDGGVEGHAANERWVEQSPEGEARAVFDSRTRSKGLAGIKPGPSEAKPKKKRAPNGTFDRKAYQREYMKGWRAKK